MKKDLVCKSVSCSSFLETNETDGIDLKKN